MKKESEYGKFEELARGILNVPHDDIRKKLEDEKRAKKRKKAKKSSASREESDRS